MDKKVNSQLKNFKQKLKQNREPQKQQDWEKMVGELKCREPMKIPSEMIEEFFDKYFSAVKKMHNSHRPTFGSDKLENIRISFDSKFEPFIGESRGYNDQNRREYLPMIDFICLAKNILKLHVSTNDIPGGRYFFSIKGIFKKDNLGNQETIAIWNIDVDNEFKEKIRKKLKRARLFDHCCRS